MKLARFARIRGIALTVAVATFGALGTVVTAAAPQEPRVPPTEGAPTFSAGRGADHLPEVCQLPSAWRGGADVAHHLPGCAAVGHGRFARRFWRARCRRGTPTRSTASSATTSASPQQEIDTIVKWASAGARRGQSGGHAGAARSSPRAGRLARRTGLRDAGRVPDSRRRARSTISTSRCRPISRKTAGCRPAKCAPAIASTCTTSSSR